MRSWKFRLWQSWLWYRLSWPFRWAHAPLCQRRRHDSFRLGRLWLCRSCTLFYTAMLESIGGTWILSLETVWGFVTLSGFAFLVVPLSYPPWYENYPRWSKDLLRSAAGVVLGGLLVLLFSPLSEAAALTLLILYLIFRRYKRRRLELGDHGCEGCPELGRGTICSGYILQANAFREYRDRIDEELNRPDRMLLLPVVRRSF